MKSVCLLIVLLVFILPTLTIAVELDPAAGRGLVDVKIEGNRKMGVDGVMKIARKEVVESVIDKRAITRKMHEKCKKAGNHCEEKSDDGGFVAFNADYHAPRHHPPKNN